MRFGTGDACVVSSRGRQARLVGLIVRHWSNPSTSGKFADKLIEQGVLAFAPGSRYDIALPSTGDWFGQYMTTYPMGRRLPVH